jgi:hypothetical protein
MNSIFDLSRPVETLKKEEKYYEALNLFKTHKQEFTKKQISENIYLISDIVTCLRKTDQFDAGFKFLQIYGIEINEQTSGKLVNSYGWLLYSKYKAENQNLHQEYDTEDFDDENEELGSENFDYHYNKSELLQKIELLIKQLLAQNNKFNGTLISNLFTVVLKSEKKKPAPNWKLINDFCNEIDPSLLSKETSTIKVEKKGIIQDMELASDFENWYSYKTKALSKLRLWQECLDLSFEALEKVEHPHYSNDVWFSRRLTLAKRNLGNTEDTIKELEKILKKKKEWFIQKELAELYLENGQVEKAFKFSMDAINNSGPIEFKIQLLVTIAEILRHKGENALSFKHFILSKLIREKEGWKIPQSLFDVINSFRQNEIPISELKNIQQELQKFWNTYSNRVKHEYKKNINPENSDEIRTGLINKILNQNDRGKNGFIKSGNEEYYFTVNQNFQVIEKIKLGVSVQFKIQIKNEKLNARIVKVLD